jgi:hypothetical protein
MCEALKVTTSDETVKTFLKIKPGSQATRLKLTRQELLTQPLQAHLQ